MQGLEKGHYWVVDDGLLLLSFLGEQHRLDVGQHTALSDGHARQQLVKLLVVADGQLKVTGNNPRLLIVTGSVAGELENLGGQVLHDGGEVHGGHQRRRARRNYPCAADGEYVPRGTADQPGKTGTWPFPSPYRPCRVQTYSTALLSLNDAQ